MGDYDVKPHPRWAPSDKSGRHPQAMDEWDYRNDPVGGAFDRSRRRLNVAMDYDDPRAPDQMALVLRVDISRLMHDWTHKNAAFEHFRGHRVELERQQWINRKLFAALKDMSEFWRYGMAKPDGAELTADDHARVEKLAKDALDALVAAAPDYLSTLPPLELDNSPSGESPRSKLGGP